MKSKHPRYKIGEEVFLKSDTKKTPMTVDGFDHRENRYIVKWLRDGIYKIGYFSEATLTQKVLREPIWLVTKGRRTLLRAGTQSEQRLGERKLLR